MLKLPFALFSFTILISGSLADESDINLFDKFQQNDYKVKYERTEVISYNTNMVKQCKIINFKYNRTCAVTNFTIEFHIDLGHEVEAIVQAYKFMSNEYRYFPIRLQVNTCLALSKNLVGVGEFMNCGNFTGCPLRKSKIMRACNWSPNETKFPPFIHNGRYMLEIQFIFRSLEVAVIRSYIEISRPFVF